MPERPPHTGPHGPRPSSLPPAAPADPDPHAQPAAPAGDPPGGDRGQLRYRSLRDLSGGDRPAQSQPPAAPTWQSQRTASQADPRAPGSESLTAGPPEDWSGSAPHARPRKRRRALLITATSLVVVVALALGGYLAYDAYAPRLGLAYSAGGTAAVNGVTFTVLHAECGLNGTPETDAQPAKAQFCVVDLNATNQTDSNRFLALSLFSVNLDSGLQADPSGSAMRTLSVKLESGESRDMRLMYDVWDGVRMSEVQVQIGYETELIRLA